MPLWSSGLTDGQQMGLPQFQTVGDDFEAVVEHAAQIGMVMRLGGQEGLDQLGVAFQGRSVQRGELPARQRGALPNVLQQLLPARGGQQRCGPTRAASTLQEDGGGAGGGAPATGAVFAGTGRSMRVSCGGPTGRPFAFPEETFPLAPHSLPFRPLWPLTVSGIAGPVAVPASMWNLHEWIARRPAAGLGLCCGDAVFASVGCLLGVKVDKCDKGDQSKSCLKPTWGG